MGMELAVIGSAIIGGISSNSATRANSAAVSQSNALTKKGMEYQAKIANENRIFNMQRYMDAQVEYEKLREIYGPLQEDLATYFKNLTGEQLSNNDIIKIQEASQKANEKIMAVMSQTGRHGSGIEAELLAKTYYDAEIAKANVRSTAEQRAIQAKANFLNVGLGQANSILNSQTGMASAINSSIYNPSGDLNRIGSTEIGLANANNALNMNYANSLKSLIGFSAANDLFGFGGNNSSQSLGNSTLSLFGRT